MHADTAWLVQDRLFITESCVDILVEKVHLGVPTAECILKQMTLVTLLRQCCQLEQLNASL